MNKDINTPFLSFYRESIAYFSGQWPKGYRLRWHRTPLWHLGTMVLVLFVSVTASNFILAASVVFWPFLIVSWMLTIHSCRKAQLVICHYAVHGTMTGRRWSDRLLVEVLSTFLFIQHFKGYYQNHIRVHHSFRLCTEEDPDVQFLVLLGFLPGMSRQALWRHLYRTMVSPYFHGIFLYARLKSNFVVAPCYRRLMSWGYCLALVSSLFLSQTWLAFFLVWVIPVFPLYHIAALLQFVSEHRWLQVSALSTLPLKEVE